MRSTERRAQGREARAVPSVSTCARAPGAASDGHCGAGRKQQAGRRRAAPVTSGRRGLLGPCLGGARPHSPRPPPAEGGAWPGWRSAGAGCRRRLRSEGQRRSGAARHKVVGRPRARGKTELRAPRGRRGGAAGVRAARARGFRGAGRRAGRGAFQGKGTGGLHGTDAPAAPGRGLCGREERGGSQRPGPRPASPRAPGRRKETAGLPGPAPQ